jgi:hypothetical protein
MMIESTGWDISDYGVDDGRSEYNIRGLLW